MSEVYVSPDGQSRMRVASPETAIRMRARGWRPESEKAAAPKPAAPKSKSEQS
ncbi:hypothetical protein AB0K34_04890 [Actinomadura sp. NPDC049382]|uniref:hypothetical protein n=1 Tax=Actinomadura sp. NPDC049382 TaxID=3158220 RepID=UPI0034243108